MALSFIDKPNIETIYSQYQAVRKTGITNMLSTPGVTEVAEALDFEELLEVIDEGDYSKILSNFEEAIKRGYLD